MTRVLGIDVSVHQGAIDFAKAYKAGARFVAIRATVGDYYTDPNFASNYKKARELDPPFLVTAYHVAAPADSAGRKIDGPTQMQRFRDVLGGRSFDLPLVVDAELERGQAKDWITRVMLDCCERIPYFTDSPCLGLVYTRQTWWDKWVEPSPEWGKYALWSARSRKGLTSPWSDGSCKFRDWNSWILWQFSGDYDDNGPGKPPGNYRGAEFGVKSSHIDLNWFNGDEAALKSFCGHKEQLPDVPPEEVSVEELWAEVEKLKLAELEVLKHVTFLSLSMDEMGKELFSLKAQALCKSDLSKLKVTL